MKEGFYRSELVHPEEQNVHQFKGQNLKDVIEYFEGVENDIQKNCNEENKPGDKKSKNQSIFDGFLDLLRDKGVRVSTPEWLQFLQVIGKKTRASELKELVETDELLNKVRLFAQTTLVKDKADEAAFHEAFDEYFELAAKIYKRELQQQEDEKTVSKEADYDSKVVPELKEQLGAQEVKDNLSKKDENHKDDEKVHGGKEDQHDDILKREDLLKQGGGDKGDKEEGLISESSKNLLNKKEKVGEEGQGQGDKGIGGTEKSNRGQSSDVGSELLNPILKREDLLKQGGGDKGDKEEGLISESSKNLLNKKEKVGEEGQGQGDKGIGGTEKSNRGQSSDVGSELLNPEIEHREKNASKGSEFSQGIRQEKSERGYLVGGGKGKSIFSERVRQDSIYKGEKINKQAIQDRERIVGKVDRRLRYETRPDKASMREVIRNIRKIILDISEIKTHNVDLKSTVRNFAKRDFRFDYNREKEKQPEIVLLIDVGGPVDEWSPLVKEVTEAMVEGLTKLEIYLFHNNLYGYVWKPDPQNLLASSYAKPDSLIDIKSIIKRRKNVIIYGDAEMSYSELKRDCWPPRDNEEGIEKFSMGGEECLNFIKKKANSVV
ncbi:MAG TPA: hypothetical protein PLY98_02585, partial [Candidatus Paceibacterota bacterium]|nr:hypothetical protein [Candidatus Paceibacterota bacterium]